MAFIHVPAPVLYKIVTRKLCEKMKIQIPFYKLGAMNESALDGSVASLNVFQILWELSNNL
jgi:hypothetical protein